MERVKKLLDEQLTKELLRITMSRPRGGTVAKKIGIRPVFVKNELLFQASRYEDTKVFHENMEKEELIIWILELLGTQFSQMEVESESMMATVLVSKKQTVTLKTHRKEVQPEESKGSRELSHNRTKQYILAEGVPVPFLVDLGIQTKEGKIVQSRYDKFRQINRYLEFIRDILDELPKGRKLTILDFGCGKSYLTFAMYYFLKILHQLDIEVIGLDLKADVIEKCNGLAEKYGYSDLHFLQGDISQYNDKSEVDMVVTLHACDTATDYALQKAVCWNAKVIFAVPCCQHEMNRQISCELLQPVLKYGLLKERMAALLTDGIRANLLEREGYETQILEFIDMEHTPKNILIRAVKKEGFRKKQKDMTEMLNFLQVEPMLQKLLDGE